MTFAEMLNYALATLLDLQSMLFVILGVFLGLIFGALPGLTATMGVALLIPMTYSLSTVQAIGAMVGCYVGGMAGGAISACLLNIPGSPAAVATTLDGHPLTKQGRGAEALGWAAFSSFGGSIVSWVLLICLATTLAKACTSFSSPEYFALAVFGLTIISAVSGDSMLKGIIAGLIGVALSFVGIDPIVGSTRFTFGNINLMSGISTIPAMIGLYSIPEIIRGCISKGNPQPPKIKLKHFVPSFKAYIKMLPNIVRSSLIGTFVGVVPATGSNIAAYLAYDTAKKFSKNPDEFGKGSIEGVAAPEAANNAVSGGALVPLLTLGIPGDGVTAVLLGGLIIHGLTPGPLLFTEHADIVAGIYTTMLIASLAMILMQMVGIKFFVKILSVPINFLDAGLVILSLVGSFALHNNFADVVLTLVLGILGYCLSLGGYPLAPIVLGLVLGGTFEAEFRRALTLSKGSYSIFFTRPICLIILVISVVSIVFTAVRKTKKAKK